MSDLSVEKNGFKQDRPWSLLAEDYGYQGSADSGLENAHEGASDVH